ncbi:hypothetical protein KVC06_06965 [Helicobacter pylori]|nr:hypothetical protein KVC06_06965 [Helicobacter pylori]
MYKKTIKIGKLNMEQYFYYQLNTAALKSRPQEKSSAKKRPFKKTRYFKRGFKRTSLCYNKFKIRLIEEGLSHGAASH